MRGAQCQACHIGPVEQRGAQQVEDGAEEREQQVAERGDERLRLSSDADQRDRSECQQFQRDVEIEQISANEKNGQRRPDRLDEDPERQRRARFRLAFGRCEIGAGVERRGGNHQGRRDQHDAGNAVRTERDAERGRKSGDIIDERRPGASNKNGDGDRDGEPDRGKAQRDAFGEPPAKNERQQNSGGRRQDREHEQRPAWRAPKKRRRLNHGAPAPSPGGLAGTSGSRAALPVSSWSRRIRATASALAAKATTMPVITSACGTGSKGKPAAAPLRATMPNTRKTPLPIKLKAENLAQRLRIDDEAVEPEPDQRRADKFRQRRCAHGSGLRRGGPATSIGSVTAIVKSMKASMKRMIGLAKPAG